MRLRVLESGHNWVTKALFALIRTVSRNDVLDIIKLVKYRADFYGKPMGAVTHEAMRGPSSWSVGDRELMAAVVAQANASTFCTQAHAAVARAAYGAGTSVAAALEDLDHAPLCEGLRAVLRLLQEQARGRALEADDVQAVLSAGVTRAQIEDALAVGFAFNTIARLAEAFDFDVPGSDAMQVGAKYLLARGYR